MRESMLVELPRSPVDCSNPMCQLRIWNQVRFRDGEPMNIDPERIRHYGFRVGDENKTPRELFADVVITHGPHNRLPPAEILVAPWFEHVPQDLRTLVQDGRVELIDVPGDAPMPGAELSDGQKVSYDPATADERLSLGLLLGQLAKSELRIVNLNHRDGAADHACYVGPLGTYEQTTTSSGRTMRVPEHTGVLWIPYVPKKWGANEQVAGYVLDVGACDRLECAYIIHRSTWGFIPRATRFVRFTAAPEAAYVEEPATATETEAAVAEEEGTSRPGEPARLTHNMVIPLTADGATTQ